MTGRLRPSRAAVRASATQDWTTTALTDPRSAPAPVMGLRYVSWRRPGDRLSYVVRDMGYVS